MFGRKKVIFAVLGVILLLCIVFVAVTLKQDNELQAEFEPLLDACRGIGVDGATTYSQEPGTHPAMGVEKTASGTLRAYSSAIPDVGLAKTWGEAELVLCLEEEKEIFIESCPYTTQGEDGETTDVVERYRYEQEVTLVEAKTAKVLANEVLQGDYPRECKAQETFLKGQDTVKLKGDKISFGDLNEWVRPYIILQ